MLPQVSAPPALPVQHSSRSLPDLNKIALISALVLLVVAVTLAILLQPHLGEQYLGFTSAFGGITPHVLCDSG